MVWRTCVGCRTVDDQRQLVRLGRTDGQVRLDPGRQVPGRGAWVHPRTGCLSAAMRRGVLSRAFRAEVRIDGDLVEQARAAHLLPEP